MEKIFAAIYDFVSDLSLIFPKYKPIAVYAGLLDVHKKSKENMNKHVTIFREWVLENSKRIYEKQLPFSSSKIQYTENAYIDMDYVLKESVDEDKNAIWQHLLTINYLLFPNERNKTILKTSLDAKQLIPSDSKEGELLHDTLEKVTKNIPADTNDPTAIMSGLFSSGIIGELMSNMQSGNIDPKKMINITQNMLQKLSNEIEK